MVDFIKISTRTPKKDLVEVFPKFIMKKSSDLMIRGQDFYAVWLDDEKRWSKEEQDVIHLVDKELDIFVENNRQVLGPAIQVRYMWDADSGMIDKWHKYCQKQLRDNFHPLDEKLIFANTVTSKDDYASKRLPYPLEDISTPAYDKLMSTLYAPEERRKIEWAIGSVVAGKSSDVQKFLVLYGAGGTGKSTVLKIIKKLFQGYTASFSSKVLGQASNQFALEAFKTNPLVAIDNEGDLAHIEDNTRLNALVSHDALVVNEKFKSQYEMTYRSFLFIATNKPVKITDAKSGLLRRLIDVTPSGDKLPFAEYLTLMQQVNFELGGIASHCKKVYLDDPEAYDNYQPLLMMEVTNHFYDFMLENYLTFQEQDGVSQTAAWKMYKVYCDEAKINYPLSLIAFKEEIATYFKNFDKRSTTLPDGTRPRNYFSGFRTEKFEKNILVSRPVEKPYEIDFKEQESIFDKLFCDCPAQYATKQGIPRKSWANVTTTLKDIDTSKLHYVYFPTEKKWYIVIDFDLRDENGNKSLALNLEAASKFPPTYAELSKSGQGIHLHYLYKGDLDALETVYSPGIEVKVFNGNSSLRRKLVMCNDLNIAELSSGLPLKEKKKGKDMVTVRKIRSSQGLQNEIIKNLNKQVHGDTSSSMDMIKKILDDAYAEGYSYDVSSLRKDIISFAGKSSNQKDKCLRIAAQLHYRSKDYEETAETMIADESLETIGDKVYSEFMKRPICFYDTEVFPNLFVICFKEEGPDAYVGSYVNPTPQQVEDFVTRYRLIDFNGRHYDRHILYARMMGYDNYRLFEFSKEIISKDKKDRNKSCFFGDAIALGYVDIFDCASKKQSLKKWEIELANKGKIVHHQELGFAWDQPVEERLWPKVVDYCTNDVYATEATWEAIRPDFIAREILADLAGGMVNDTTNSLTTKIIFGKERNPQSQFQYRDLAKKVQEDDLPDDMIKFLDLHFPKMMNYWRTRGDSILPFFEGYYHDGIKSVYRGEEVGEGGYVYAEPGIHLMVALLDIASMHPHSDLAEYLFGPWAQNFYDLVYARVAIKHEDWDSVRTMLGGKLAPYISDVLAGKISSKDLAYALKIAINSVYGLTAASFPNPFRDPRNVDNIVAKRGALFMVDLKHEVQNKGFTVAHIKTDSIKVPYANKDIIDFVTEFGEKYGYTFEHEETYDRMCLVNDAVYIAKYKEPHIDKETGREIWWTATGTQFQVPYVFKTLFSHEDLVFSDFCETKSVSKGDIYIDMNETLPDVTAEEKELDKARTKFMKGELSDTTMAEIQGQLEPIIEAGHKYNFVGRVGSFVPIKPGCGGGVLYRKYNDKYYAVTGTKGYRWLEAEVVKMLHKEDDIDYGYFENLAIDAKEAIEQYGPFKAFVSDKPYDEAALEWAKETLTDIWGKDYEKTMELVANDPDAYDKYGKDVVDLSNRAVRVLWRYRPVADVLLNDDFMNIPENAPDEIPFL